MGLRSKTKDTNGCLPTSCPLPEPSFANVGGQVATVFDGRLVSAVLPLSNSKELEEKKRALEKANSRIQMLELTQNTLEVRVFECVPFSKCYSFQKRLEICETERSDLAQTCAKHVAEIEKLKKKEAEMEQELAKAEDVKDAAVKVLFFHYFFY